jgi:hypothetical protein
VTLLRYSRDMAIMERVRNTTHAAQPGTADSATSAAIACADCGVSGTQMPLALWSFDRTQGHPRFTCPECVIVALPGIEACTDCA